MNRRTWRLWRGAVLPLVTLTLVGAAGAARAQNDFKTATALANAEISPAQLRAYLSFIASDELGGRDTPSLGLNVAAKFIATNLSRWGVKPMGGDGTYFQKMTLSRTNVDPEKSTLSLGGTTYKAGTDFTPLASGAGGTATGQLVYVGHGFYIKSMNVDAYKGLDVKGKIVVTSSTLPRGVDPRSLGNLGKQGEDWMTPVDYAVKNGAAGILIVPAFESDNEWRAYVTGATRQRGGFQPSVPQAGGLPILTVSPKMVEQLFTGEKLTAAQVRTQARDRSFDAGFELGANKTLTMTSAVNREEQVTQNVVGVIEGSDPQLKNEYVALGAHYDHVGTRTGGSGDQIFNGADDDGSGTVALMAIAEAISKSKVKPRRSILFIWHCGEEKGLWGSEYFVENPTVPLKQIVAQVNIDMIGRSKPAGDTNARNRDLSGPTGIYVIGSTMMSSELAPLTKRVNDNYLKLQYDYRYDAPDDPNRFFYRSDHFNYARKGIPVLFYFDGEHVDYHRPGDEWEKIDYNKLTLVTRTVLATVAELANRDKRLVVDKPLDR